MERNEKTTPITAIKSKMKNLSDEITPVILVSTGSYNPAHKMHLQIFSECKKGLEGIKNENFVVVGNFISPSHQQYLERKFGKRKHLLLSEGDRKKIIQMQIEELQLDVVLDTWELSQKRFIDFPYVVKSLRKYIDENLDKSVRIFYVCGMDHFQKCRFGCIRICKSNLGVVCLTRKGYSSQNVPKMKNLIIVESPLNFDVSSTDLRNRIANKKDCSKLVSKNALEYLKKKYSFRKPISV